MCFPTGSPTAGGGTAELALADLQWGCWAGSCCQAWSVPAGHLRARSLGPPSVSFGRPACRRAGPGQAPGEWFWCRSVHAKLSTAIPVRRAVLRKTSVCRAFHSPFTPVLIRELLVCAGPCMQHQDGWQDQDKPTLQLAACLHDRSAMTKVQAS